MEIKADFCVISTDASSAKQLEAINYQNNDPVCI